MDEKDVNELCKATYEMMLNCDSDLVEDHRRFYNPRIRNTFIIVAKIFPVQMGRFLAKETETPGTG